MIVEIIQNSDFGVLQDGIQLNKQPFWYNLVLTVFVYRGTIFDKSTYFNC